jgi:hypothetical protein
VGIGLASEARCGINVCVVDRVGRGACKVLDRLLRARHIVECQLGKSLVRWEGKRKPQVK